MVVGSESGAACACTADRCGALVLVLTLLAFRGSARAAVGALDPAGAGSGGCGGAACVCVDVCVRVCVRACVLVCVSTRPCCARCLVYVSVLCACARASAMCKCPSLRSSVNLCFVCVRDSCWCGRLVGLPRSCQTLHFLSASSIVVHACGMVVSNRRSPLIEKLFASQTRAS